MCCYLVDLFSQIELDAPPEGASVFEIQLRESIVKTVAGCPGMTQNLAHSYMNASAYAVHTHCKMFNKTLEVRAVISNQACCL